MVKKYCVRLTEEEQAEEELRALVSKGRAAAYKQTHARILLLSDENQADGAMKDGEISRALKAGTATVERVRRRCVEKGVEAARVAGSNCGAVRRSWMVRGRPTTYPVRGRLSWLWPALNRRKDGSVGPCKCCLTDWWNGR